MPDHDRILALPIRVLDKSPKRVLFELADGARFYLVGGQDRRPLNGAAGFSPREMIMVLNHGIEEEAFKALIRLKRFFGGGIESIEM